MHIRSLLIGCLAAAALMAPALPALAGGWDCVTDTNVTYLRGSEKNPTQTCRSLVDCPTPSMFASLSGQVSNGANDLPDTHTWELTKHGHVVYVSSEKPGACPS